MSKWISYWDKQWKRYEIFLYLYDWVEKKCVLEKLPALSYGLYYTYISTIEMHVMVNHKFTNQNECLVWHNQLDDMYCTYISTIKMHVMVNQKFTNQNEFLVWYDQNKSKWILCWVILDLLWCEKKGWKIHVDTHLRVKKLLQTNKFSCTIRSQKLIIRQPLEKLEMSQSHFQNEYRVIFVVQYTHHVDHLYISWF